MNYKSMYKNELADAAGVSRSTFYRWLRNDQQVLLSMGVASTCHLLPPHVVRYICEKYCIGI